MANPRVMPNGSQMMPCGHRVPGIWRAVAGRPARLMRRRLLLNWDNIWVSETE